MKLLRWSALTIVLAVAIYLVEQPLSRWVFDALGVSRISHNWTVQLLVTALIFGAAWVASRWMGLDWRIGAGSAALATTVSWPLFMASQWLAAASPISWDLLSTPGAYMTASLVWAIEIAALSFLMGRLVNGFAARLTSAST